MGSSTDRVHFKFNWVRAALKFKQSRNKSEEGAIKSFGLRCEGESGVEEKFSITFNNKNNDRRNASKG